MAQEPVVIAVKFKIGNNPIGIPPDSLLDVRIEIIDEYEIIRTSYARFTQDLVRIEKLKPSHKGTIPKYSERLQKAIIKFPDLSQKEIADIVAQDLKKMGVEV